MNGHTAYTSNLGVQKPLRVLHIVAAGEFGGAEAQILALVGQLRRHAVEARVATFYEGEFTRRARAQGIEAQALSSGSPLHDYVQVKKAVQRFAPQIIHTHGVRASLAGRTVGEELNVPVVTTVHSDLYHDYAQPLKRSFMMALEHMTRDKSARVIAVSQSLAGLLLARGYSADQVVAIPNGLDLEQSARVIAEAREHPANIKDELGIPDAAQLVISVARLQPVKHLSALVEAVAGIRQVGGRPVHLILVGDGPDRALLAARAQDQESAEGGARIHLIGQRHDVLALLLEADVFALPSLMEGMPISILEAMSCGLPVVASRVGGIPDIVASGAEETGILVPPTDEEALREAIASLLKNSERRQEMGQRAKRRVHEHFSVAKMVNSVVDLYRNMTFS